VKVTKRQLKQIIKEEVEETLTEAVAGGIDEFASNVGVEPLPHRFTDQQLVDFTYKLLEATAAKAPTMEPIPGWQPDVKPGQTHKQTQQKIANQPLQQSGDHPLTTSKVGFALEKLIMARYNKSKDPGMREELLAARKAILAVVSPSGQQVKRLNRRDLNPELNPRAAKPAGGSPSPGSTFGLPRSSRMSRFLGLSETVTKSQLKQIIKEEVEIVLENDAMADYYMSGGNDAHTYGKIETMEAWYTLVRRIVLGDSKDNPGLLSSDKPGKAGTYFNFRHASDEQKEALLKNKLQVLANGIEKIKTDYGPHRVDDAALKTNKKALITALSNFYTGAGDDLWADLQEPVWDIVELVLKPLNPEDS